MLQTKGKLILILGGARSGKSRMAEEMALASGKKTAYIATATVYDAEMARRVEIHQERRPGNWVTVEEDLDLVGALHAVPPETQMVIVDCLTLWLTNVLLSRYEEKLTADSLEQIEAEIYSRLATFCAAAREKPYTTIVVSNEVGCGIVPESPLGRLFRDIAGRANQQAAKEADAVWLAVAGYPVRVKGEE
jgi:adenosylcobinamide kinase/adenosylcobinamide-phosphate guanylyltransferase